MILIDEKVKCLLCIKEKGFSLEYSLINNSHLKRKHGIDIDKYKKFFPNVLTYGKDFIKKASKGGKRVHELYPEISKNKTECLQKGLRKWLNAGNNPLDFHKIGCKCIGCRARRGEDLSKLHKPDCQCPVCMLKRGEDCSEKYPNNCGNGKRFEKWKKENPDEAKKLLSDEMKRRHKENPKSFIEINKKSSKEMKKWHKKQKEDNSEEYYNRFKEMSKLADIKKPNHSRNGGINVHKLHPNLASENGIKSLKTIRENKPYIWEDVHFMSKEEMECAKLILNKPVLRVNCHIKIKRAIIDFFPQDDDKMFQGKLVEYHPWDSKMSLVEYKKSREEKISKSYLAGIKLVVIKKLKPIELV